MDISIQTQGNRANVTVPNKCRIAKIGKRRSHVIFSESHGISPVRPAPLRSSVNFPVKVSGDDPTDGLESRPWTLPKRKDVSGEEARQYQKLDQYFRRLRKHGTIVEKGKLNFTILFFAFFLSFSFDGLSFFYSFSYSFTSQSRCRWHFSRK